MQREILRQFENIKCRLQTLGGFVFSDVEFEFISDDSDIIEFIDDKLNMLVTLSSEYVQSVMTEGASRLKRFGK